MTKVRIKEVISQLFSPFSYLWVFKHGAKSWYDIKLPFILALLTSFLVYMFISPMNILPLIEDLNSFISSLPGFFIAALAAIATFGSEDIDKTMGGIMKKRKDGEGNQCELPVSRRNFLSSLFAYLTALSFIIVVLTNISIYGDISFWGLGYYIDWIGFFIFFFLLWHLILTSFLGLYYLGYRLHETN